MGSCPEFWDLSIHAGNCGPLSSDEHITMLVKKNNIPNDPQTSEKEFFLIEDCLLIFLHY
jgi:hypothetical protein